MSEFNVGDYEIYANANKTTKKIINSCNSLSSDIKTNKSNVNNESTFLGPIAENCDKAMEHYIGLADTLAEQYGIFSSFLTDVETSYKKSDQDAVSKLLQMDFDGGSGTGTINATTLGNDYKIVNTKANFFEFYKNVISGKQLYQSANYKQYRDQCLGFSYQYAWGLYTNNANITGADCKNGTSAGNNFKRYTTNNESEYYQKLYDELSAGRPVVIQVIGSRKNRSRHYVTAVGFKNTVKSAADLKPTDVLIVDSYDGEIEATTPKGSSNGRYIAKGTDINSGRYHYGYEMYYINT